MQQYKKDFIKFMVDSNVLTFGDFTTKSGRKTPFFINTGKYRTGKQILKLGEFYAQAIINEFPDQFDVLFGPAYKGIPLVVTVASTLARLHGIDPAFCFNRKEAKSHGECGVLVGHNLKDNDRILIVEDVTTAGTSIRETVPILKSSATVILVGLIVSVDRMEKGTGEKSALSEICDQFKMKTTSIVTLDDIVSYLHNNIINGTIFIDDDMLEKINAYRAVYGINRCL